MKNNSMALCPHFCACGGCTAQGMQPEAYREYKEDLIAGALRLHGLEIPLDDFISCPPASRRRITLSFMRDKNNIVLGFHGPRSDDIVPIHTCLVAKPEIVAALPGLHDLLQHVTPKKPEGKAMLLASDSGLDVEIESVKALDRPQRAALIQQASILDYARLSVNGDVLAQFRAPQLKMGKANVTPPPGGFVQAVEEAEVAIAKIVLTTLVENKVKSVADLFAGCGAFTLRMVEQCRVHAVESDTAALTALQQAARNTQGLKPVTVEKRDLFRRPLLPHELNKFDAVILDPPWQGAAAQTAQLAKSTVPLIAYISCNPGTFARDAKSLIEASYCLASLTAIDQFLWSEHVEVVGIFKSR